MKKYTHHWNTKILKEIKPIETTLSSVARKRKISFNLKPTLTQTKQKTKTNKNHLRIDLVNKKKQNKDLKIYANAKPKFKPKCLTSNVKKTQKTSKTRSSEKQAKFIIS